MFQKKKFLNASFSISTSVLLRCYSARHYVDILFDFQKTITCNNIETPNPTKSCGAFCWTADQVVYVTKPCVDFYTIISYNTYTVNNN